MPGQFPVFSLLPYCLLPSCLLNCLLLSNKIFSFSPTFFNGDTVCQCINPAVCQNLELKE